MQVFVRNCTHILTRTQGKKFEDMFLVKIASQGTSLSLVSYSCDGRKHRCKHVSDSVPSSFDTREHFDYNIRQA